MDETSAAFGALLRQIRRERRLSLREFEKVTHHSKTLVWEWESGRKVPSGDVVARLDHLLNADGRLAVAAATSEPVSGTHIASEISRHYAHQGRVAEQIRRRAVDAAELDVLAVRGLGIIALNDSLLRPTLAGRTEPLKVRVLLLDPDCDAAVQRAREIGESATSFAAGLKLALARIEEIASGANLDLSVGLYTSLPVGRIIRVDSTQWVSSFGADWEGHESSIYEIPFTPRGSLGAGYRRQFDDMHTHARRVI